MKKSLTTTALCAALALCFAPALPACAQPAGKVSGAASDQARKQLDAIASEYWDAVARFEPIGASERGDNRFDDQIGKSIAPATRAAQFSRLRGFAKRLAAIDRFELDTKAQINYDILDYELKTALTYEKIPEHLLPLNQMDSVPVTLANYAGGEAAQRLTTVKEYKAYLNRLNQLPGWIDQAIANMREGMKKGIVLQKAVTVSALPQFQKLVSPTTETNIYYTPIKKMPSTFSAKEKQELTAAYRKTIGGKLSPALARLATFMEKEYLPATRSTTGAQQQY